jgi:hypothetical protein
MTITIMSRLSSVLVVREIHCYLKGSTQRWTSLNRQSVTKGSDELLTDHLCTHYLAKQSQSTLGEGRVETTYTLLPRVIPRSQPLVPTQGR